MKFTHETLRRALRTLIQTAVSYIAVNIVLIDFTGEPRMVERALIGVCVSAVAAGMAAIMNLEKDEGANDEGN